MTLLIHLGNSTNYWKLSDAEKNVFRRQFQQIDRNSDGKITPKELQDYYSKAIGAKLRYSLTYSLTYYLLLLTLTHSLTRSYSLLLTHLLTLTHSYLLTYSLTLLFLAIWKFRICSKKLIIIMTTVYNSGNSWI